MKLKKWFLMSLCAVLILTGFLSVSHAETSTKTLNGRYAQTEARAMLSMINEYRVGGSWYWNSDNTTKTTIPAGTLGTLTYDYGLERIAMQRAAEIVALFDHQRPNGKMCFSCTYNGVQTYGENIASGFPSTESVFVAWREDDEDYAGQGHRRNMLETRWGAVGIGCFVYNGTKYWVQEFGEENSGLAETSANDSEASVDIEVMSGNDTLPTIEFTSQPQSVTANPGDVVTFSVKVTGSDTYQWFYQTPSEADTEYWYGYDDCGAATDTYTVTVTEDMNGYKFTCGVWDASISNWILSEKAVLTVNGAPDPVTTSTYTLSFSTTTLDGKAYSSDVIKNYDLVVVNIWGEWCGPCVSELPSLQKISQNYKNVLILGVWYGNSAEEALKTAQDAGVTYPLLHPTGMLTDLRKASSSYPHTFFFDGNGQQVGSMEVGATDYSGWESTIKKRLAMASSGSSTPSETTVTPTPTPVSAPDPATTSTETLSFNTTTLDGRPYSSDAMQSYDLVVLNFWGEWCGPCVWELPYLQQISQNYKNVLILGAWYGDSEEEALKTAQDAGVTYPLLHPTGMLEDYLWASNSFPHTFFFDSNGRQVGDMEVGATDYSGWESTIKKRLAMASSGSSTPSAPTPTSTSTPTSTPTPTATPTPTPEPATIKKVQAKKSVKLTAPKVKGNAYQWYVRANRNAAWQSMGKKGAKDKLSVKATMALDGYQYRCQITNASGVKYTDIYELYVYEQLKVKKQPKWTKKSLPGTKMTLSITATGADSYQWMTRPNGSAGWTVIEGATGTSYVVDVQEGMAGRQYACQIKGRQGTVLSKAAAVKLAPWPKVKISKQPVLKKPVATGSPVTLTVKAANAETYQWYYRTSAKGAWIIMGGETKPTVTITAGAGMNGYQYKCTVKGKGGTVDTKPVTLKVLAP